MTTTLSANGANTAKASMDLSEQTPNCVDKVSRYGWIMKDEPGTQMWIHKKRISVHPSYQRDLSYSKVKVITAEWKWVSFGTLVIGERNGEYWVIDGQHRLVSANRRSDISELPCIVFKTEGIRDEALAFLDVNSGRQPVSALAKHKARVAAQDELAVFVQEQIESLGLNLSKGKSEAGRIKCIAWCMRCAKEDRAAFVAVLSLGAALSLKDDVAVHERLLEALRVINTRCGAGLSDKRLVGRIHEKGARVLMHGINRAAALYAAGGGRVWAEGLLEEINKGLRHKFSITR